MYFQYNDIKLAYHPVLGFSELLDFSVNNFVKIVYNNPPKINATPNDCS